MRVPPRPRSRSQRVGAYPSLLHPLDGTTSTTGRTEATPSRARALRPNSSKKKHGEGLAFVAVEGGRRKDEAAAREAKIRRKDMRPFPTKGGGLRRCTARRFVVFGILLAMTAALLVSSRRRKRTVNAAIYGLALFLVILQILREIFPGMAEEWLIRSCIRPRNRPSVGQGGEGKREDDEMEAEIAKEQGIEEGMAGMVGEDSQPEVPHDEEKKKEEKGKAAPNDNPEKIRREEEGAKENEKNKTEERKEDEMQQEGAFPSPVTLADDAKTSISHTLPETNEEGAHANAAMRGRRVAGDAGGKKVGTEVDAQNPWKERKEGWESRRTADGERLSDIISINDVKKEVRLQLEAFGSWKKDDRPGIGRAVDGGGGGGGGVDGLMKREAEEKERSALASRLAILESAVASLRRRMMAEAEAEEKYKKEKDEMLKKKEEEEKKKNVEKKLKEERKEAERQKRTEEERMRNREQEMQRTKKMIGEIEERLASHKAATLTEVRGRLIGFEREVSSLARKYDDLLDADRQRQQQRQEKAAAEEEKGREREAAAGLIRKMAEARARREELSSELKTVGDSHERRIEVLEERLLQTQGTEALAKRIATNAEALRSLRKHTEVLRELLNKLNRTVGDLKDRSDGKNKETGVVGAILEIRGELSRIALDVKLQGHRLRELEEDEEGGGAETCQLAGEMKAGVALKRQSSISVANTRINKTPQQEAQLQLSMLKPFLGIKIDPGKEQVVAAENPSSSFGVPITSVYPHSPAAVAGLLEGDVIIFLDGKTIQSRTALMALLRTKRPGDRFETEVLRKGEQRRFVVTVGTPDVSMTELVRLMRLAHGLSSPSSIHSRKDFPTKKKLMQGKRSVQSERTTHLSGEESNDRRVHPDSPMRGAFAACAVH